MKLTWVGTVIADAARARLKHTISMDGYHCVSRYSSDSLCITVISTPKEDCHFVRDVLKLDRVAFPSRLPDDYFCKNAQRGRGIYNSPAFPISAFISTSRFLNFLKGRTASAQRNGGIWQRQNY